MPANPFIGPSYKLDARPASVQRTVNAYPAIMEVDGGKGQARLEVVEGLTSFSAWPLAPVNVGYLGSDNPGPTTVFVSGAAFNAPVGYGSSPLRYSAATPGASVVILACVLAGAYINSSGDSAPDLAVGAGSFSDNYGTTYTMMAAIPSVDYVQSPSPSVYRHTATAMYMIKGVVTAAQWNAGVTLSGTITYTNNPNNNAQWGLAVVGFQSAAPERTQVYKTTVPNLAPSQVATINVPVSDDNHNAFLFFAESDRYNTAANPSVNNMTPILTSTPYCPLAGRKVVASTDGTTAYSVTASVNASLYAQPYMAMMLARVYGK